MDHLYTIFILILSGLLYLLVNQSSCVKINSPNTIYPCLDSYDILITNSTVHLDLIRIYTTDDTTIPFRHFRYLGELRLPLNNLVKIDCNYFNSDYRYYCFSIVGFGINGSIAYFDRPLCKATLAENALPDDQTAIDSGSTERLNLTTLAPYGPSFQITSYKDAYTIEDLNEDDDDEDGHDTIVVEAGSGASEARRRQTSARISARILCKCNQVISLNISNTVLIQSANGCPNAGNSIGYTNETGCTSCILKLPETTELPVIAMKLVRIIQCDQQIVSLIIRDGQTSIDRMLDVTEEWSEYQLSSSYLLFQTTGTSIDYIIRLKMIHIHGSINDEQLGKLFNIPIMHIILASFLIFLFCSLIVLWCVSFLTKKRASKVQILLTDEGPTTSTSYLNNASIDQFSFTDAQSLEMDYYDLKDAKK